MEGITYYDGLGRPKQQIASKAGGQAKDIITPFTYDVLNRQTINYLPYVNLGQTPGATSLNYIDNDAIISVLPQYYQNKYPNDFGSTVNPYSEKSLEFSPLNRVLEQSAPGEDWALDTTSDNDHTIKMEYAINSLDENDTSKDNVRLLNVFHPTADSQQIALTINGYYPSGTLYKSIIKDENWTPNQTAPNEKDHTIEEFTNKTGQVLLKRVYNTEAHDTYYVYDNFGNLTYVLPPLVDLTDGISPNELNQLCYQYKYDYRNRLIEKKIPGKGWEYIVYDKLDRPLLTQDANLRTTNQWLFTKYDVFNRIIYTGLVTNTNDRAAIQSSLGFSFFVDEIRMTVPVYINGTNVYYSNNSYPNDASVKVLTVNYYDDYLWNPENTSEDNYNLATQLGIQVSNNTISKTATGSWSNAGFTTEGQIEEDGYIQYTVGSTTQRVMVGLSAIDSAENHHYNTIDYAIYTGYGDLQRVYIYKEGDFESIPITTFQGGDTFKVERSGNKILFKKNGLIFHTIPTNYTGTLIGDGSLYDRGTKISNVHIGYSSNGQAFTTNAKGLPTGTLVKTLTTDQWITTIPYYDEKARVIHSTSQNDYLNTKDVVSNVLDFSGKALKSRTKHTLENTEFITTLDEFTYDNSDRLLYQTQRINGSEKELISRNTYDELGQLTKKQVGGALLDLNNYTSIVNLQVDGNTITKTSDNNWDGGLATSTFINGDGYLGYTISQSNRSVIIGLSETAGTSSYQGIKYAIYNRPDGTVNLFDAGTQLTNMTNYVPCDSFAVERRANRIYYLKNGEVFHISNTIDNGQPLLGDVALYYLNSSITNMVLVDLENELQEVDYTYNVRGWLKGINNVNAPGNDLFSFALNYNDIADPSKQLFNGNISSTSWRTLNEDSNLKNYVYQYDALNRITEAVDNTGNYNLNLVNYDKNGNILNLNRTGHINENATAFNTMDNLTYNYTGNQLNYVKDASGISYGFNDGNINTIDIPNNDYNYDTNGNMIEDKNKDITSITYNHLNLPTKVIFNNDTNKSISYIYDAIGTKLEKQVSYNTNSLTITRYAGNYVYKEDNTVQVLQFFNHPEGYIEPKDITGTGFEYTYQYKDHLGNIRLSYRDYDKDGQIDVLHDATDIDGDGDYQHEIVEEKNYYPFGLKHEGYNNNVLNGTNHSYGYNGKEENTELGIEWLDFGARNYDASIGRWMNIDPLSEEMLRHSPYNYAFNNPIYWIDPDGMAPSDDYFNEQGEYLGSDNSETSKVRIIQQSVWNDKKTANKEGGETISNKDGNENSVAFSESDLQTRESLNVYQHYNHTDLVIKDRSEEFDDAGMAFFNKEVGGAAFVARQATIDGVKVTSEHLEINIEGNKNGSIKVADDANMIRSNFVHENKHYSDYKAAGFDNHAATSRNLKERSAVIAQMNHPTFSKTSKAFQQSVINYGRQHGLVIPLKSGPASGIRTYTPKTNIQIKL